MVVGNETGHPVLVRANPTTRPCQQLRRMSGLTETIPCLRIPRADMNSMRKNQIPTLSLPSYGGQQGPECSSRPAGPQTCGSCTPYPHRDMVSHVSPSDQVPLCQGKCGKGHAPEMAAVTRKEIVGNFMTLLLCELVSLKGFSPPHYPAVFDGVRDQGKKDQ